MKNLVYLFIGIFFGIILFKSEAVSWYRIYEMFRFESFHMYGIIGMAVGLGVIIIQIFKKTGTKSMFGEPISFKSYQKGFSGYIIGGSLFGLGWGLAGACPGPIYIMVGAGEWAMAIVLVAAIFGALLFGLFKKYLVK